jgi:hypothetical protein
MVVGDKRFGVVSYVIAGLHGLHGGILPQKSFVFSTPSTASHAFSEIDFWKNSVTLYTVDRLNLQLT